MLTNTNAGSKFIKAYRYIVKFAPIDSVNIPLLCIHPLIVNKRNLRFFSPMVHTTQFVLVGPYQLKMNSFKWTEGIRKILSGPISSKLAICSGYIHKYCSRDKADAISQTSSSAFLWIKMFEFRLKFHWSLFPGVQLTIYQHWFR